MSEKLASPASPAPLTVSVVIPCYNAAKFLAEAVQSVLAQNIPGCEIVIIDDGSTDNTGEVIKSLAQHPELRVLTHPGHINEGVCTSRQLGIREARGEFVAFLDSDDTFLPGKLARHIGILRDNPKVVLVHSPVQFHSQDQNISYGWNCSMGEQAMTYDLTKQGFYLRRNMIANSTVVCRRAAIFPDDLPEDMIVPAEDWVIWNSMATRGLFHFDPQPLTSVLVHGESYTSRLTRWPGTTELRAIEFYLSVITRLPDTRSRLRALFILGYYMFKLAKIRAGANWRPGIFARTLDWIFNRAK